MAIASSVKVENQESALNFAAASGLEREFGDDISTLRAAEKVTEPEDDDELAETDDDDIDEDDGDEEDDDDDDDTDEEDVEDDEDV